MSDPGQPELQQEPDAQQSEEQVAETTEAIEDLKPEGKDDLGDVTGGRYAAA